MRAVIIILLVTALAVVSSWARIVRVVEITDIDEKTDGTKNLNALSDSLKDAPIDVQTRRKSYILLNKELGCVEFECQAICWLSGYKYGKCFDADHCLCTNV